MANKCDVCGAKNCIIILDKSGYYCEMCWYHKHKPILVLTTLWDSIPLDEGKVDILFSPKINRCVYPARGQLEKCGFTLFNKKEYFNKQANGKYKEIYIYKYSGNTRCLALNDYTAWPSRMKDCCKIGCNIF